MGAQSLAGAVHAPRFGPDQTCPRDEHGQPRRFAGGCGAYLFDQEGERWIDFDNGRGSVLLGHADAGVAEAIREAAAGALGTTTGWSPLLDRVFDLVWSLLGGETLAMFRTGTSALRSVACAVRETRAAELGVERPLILSAGYHGYDPMWRSPKVPFETNADGIVDFLFDLDVLDDLLRRPERVAALFISPDRSSLTPQWYASVRALATEAGVPIVADEVKVGLRYGTDLVARSLEPDVWVVAKTIGNGAPIAITGGRADLLAPLEEVSFTSFFEPTVLAAACATLERVATGEPQRQIGEHGAAFIDSARASLAAAHVPIAIGGDAHLFHFVSACDEVESAFLSACTAEKLLLFAGDNQAPSAALAGDALTDACNRFAAVCDRLGGRFEGLAIGEDAWYGAAWNVMDGLAARPRVRSRTRELVAQFWDD